jgi:hypothetical protein
VAPITKPLTVKPSTVKSPPDLGPILEGLPDDETSENLPARLSFDLPEEWRQPLESLRSRPEPVRLSPATLKVLARAALGIVTVVPTLAKSGAASQTKGRTNRTYEKIRQVAASKWPNGYAGVRSRDLIKVVGDATGEKPDTILRALNRRKG